jgi:hypothetical protein
MTWVGTIIFNPEGKQWNILLAVVVEALSI